MKVKKQDVVVAYITLGMTLIIGIFIVFVIATIFY